MFGIQYGKVFSKGQGQTNVDQGHTISVIIVTLRTDARVHIQRELFHRVFHAYTWKLAVNVFTVNGRNSNSQLFDTFNVQTLFT